MIKPAPISNIEILLKFIKNEIIYTKEYNTILKKKKKNTQNNDILYIHIKNTNKTEI